MKHQLSGNLEVRLQLKCDPLLISFIKRTVCCALECIKISPFVCKENFTNSHFFFLWYLFCRLRSTVKCFLVHAEYFCLLFVHHNLFDTFFSAESIWIFYLFLSCGAPFEQEFEYERSTVFATSFIRTGQRDATKLAESLVILLAKLSFCGLVIRRLSVYVADGKRIFISWFEQSTGCA